MRDFIEKASLCYYSGAPIISDAEFDSLVAKYSYDQVGHTVTDGVPHLYRMYSLQKYFDISEAGNITDYVKTPKLDGAAVSLLYVNKHLALALTRGDGNLGREITDKLALLVPNTISLRGEVFITGEVVCPSTVPNARNVAAGSLNLKDPAEFAARAENLAFVAYDIRSKIELQLPGVSARLFGRGAGDTFSFFLPTSSRIFNLLSNPLREWVGEIGTGQSSYLDVGSYIKVSSPHLRGYEDTYGVTDGIGMIRGIRQSLEGEGCELSIITVGISPVNWNSSMKIASVTNTTTIEVEANEYTTTAQGQDSDFFKAGNVVQHIPRGNQDGAGSQLTIDSVSGTTITFTAAHSISSGGGTIEPATYSSASPIHKEDAYLSNNNDIINVTTDAQEFN